MTREELLKEIADAQTKVYEAVFNSLMAVMSGGDRKTIRELHNIEREAYDEYMIKKGEFERTYGG